MDVVDEVIYVFLLQYFAIDKFVYDFGTDSKAMAEIFQLTLLIVEAQSVFLSDLSILFPNGDFFQQQNIFLIWF